MLKLVKVRECDSACCRESPRFPNADHSDCIYNDGEDKTKGCSLQRDPSLIPRGSCPAIPRMTAKEAVQETCIDWPQNSPQRLGSTSECCWQWVEDVN